MGNNISKEDRTAVSIVTFIIGTFLFIIGSFFFIIFDSFTPEKLHGPAIITCHNCKSEAYYCQSRYKHSSGYVLVNIEGNDIKYRKYFCPKCDQFSYKKEE